MGRIRRKAEDDAQRILGLFAPDSIFPIEPVNIARAMGVHVFVSQLDDDVRIMLVGGALDQEIHVDRNDAPTSRRSLVAHMLGHVVARAGDISRAESIVHRAGEWPVRMPARITAEEAYAVQFAAGLLVPACVLGTLSAAYPGDVSRLAQLFAVTPHLVRNRLRHLGITATPDIPVGSTHVPES